MEELKNPNSQQHYLKYGMLAAHANLKATGQKVGASAALCHIKKIAGGGNTHYCLNVANVGDTEIVVSRCGEAVPMTRHFMIQSDKDECQRICRSDGIITEDGRVSGVTYCTRMLGSSYLYPHVIPSPHVTSVNLRPEDQLIIIANCGLWKYLSYQEAVNEVVNIPDPVVAAKHLQDLAQGYGSRESIGVLVIRLILSESERNRVKNIVQEQFEFEQKLLSDLKQRDVLRNQERKKRRAQLAPTAEGHSVNMDKLRLRQQDKKRKQAVDIFGNSEANGGEYVSLKHMSSDKSLGAVDSSDWQTVLEQRLREEVRDKELEYFLAAEEIDLDAELGPNVDGADSNWETGHKKYSTGKYLGDNSDILGRHIVQAPVPVPCDFNASNSGSALMEPTPSMESVDFVKEYKIPFNIDRDAVLFHQMQMTRSKSHGASSDSLDSIQSVPVSGSVKQVPMTPKISSHSIEVLINRTASLPRDTSFGGSLPEQPDKMDEHHTDTERRRRSRWSKHGKHEELETNIGAVDAGKNPIGDKLSVSEGTLTKVSKRKQLSSLRKSGEKNEHQNVQLTKSDEDKGNARLETVSIINDVEQRKEIGSDATQTELSKLEEKESESIYVNQRKIKQKELEFTVSVDELKNVQKDSHFQEELNANNVHEIQFSEISNPVPYSSDKNKTTDENKSTNVNLTPEVNEVSAHWSVLIDDSDRDQKQETRKYFDKDPALHVFSSPVINHPTVHRQEDTSVVSAYKDSKALTGVKNRSSPTSGGSPILTPKLPSVHTEHSQYDPDGKFKSRKTRRAPSPPLNQNQLIQNEQNLLDKSDNRDMKNGSPRIGRSNGHNIELAIEDLFAQIDKKRHQVRPEKQKTDENFNSLTSLKEMFRVMEQQVQEPEIKVQKSHRIRPRAKDKKQAPDRITEKPVKSNIVPSSTQSVDSFIGKSLPEQTMIITYL